MRKDAGVDGDAQRIGQLGWMLFLKIFDDQEQELERFTQDDYKSPIPERFRWSNWATDPEGITGDTLLQDFINNDSVHCAEGTQHTHWNQPTCDGGAKSVFEDAYNYMKNGTLVRQVINKLNEIDFNRSEIVIPLAISTKSC